MKTKETTIQQTLNIWAIPLTPYERENLKNPEPFNFQIRTDVCWNTGAVKVHTVDVAITIPAGIDLTTKAIETLNEAKRVLKAEAAANVAEIDKMIEGLTCIEYNPLDDGGEF